MTAMPAVLVVDDDLAAAQDYARLINQRTGLVADFAAEPARASAIVSTGGVAVVVLDQRMPQASGVELFQSLRSLDSRIRGILLTGEASPDEVGSALNQGFSKYVHKPRALDELPSVVRHEFIEYQNLLLLEVSAERPVLAKRRHGRVFGSSIVYTFFGMQILDEKHVRAEEWREILTLQAGQTQRLKLTRSSTWTLQLEDEMTERLGTTFALGVNKVAELKTQLQTEVTQRLKESLSTSITMSGEVEQTFALPAEPADVNQVHVRARRIQQAPVYIETLLELMADCGCCRRPSLIQIRALVATGALALRHVDHLSDGTSKLVELGHTAAAD